MTKKQTKTLMEDSVNQRIIRINPMALVSIFLKGTKIEVSDGIPAGTQYVGGGYDAATNCFFLHVQNKRFDPIKVGDKLPDQPITLTDINAKETSKEK